jgi:ferritin-like metal-binding protein YciE
MNQALYAHMNNKIKKKAWQTVEQIENRVSGTENKVEELNQIVKGQEKILTKYE